MDGSIRLAVVDGHDIFRTGLLRALVARQQLQVVAAVGTIGQLPDSLAGSQQDVVLLDPGPRDDLFKSIEQVFGHCPDTRAIVLSAAANESELFVAASAGVHGYVSKSIDIATLASVIAAVKDGQRYFEPSIAAIALSSPLNDAVQKLEVLTDRERDVLRLLAKARTNREMADATGLPQHIVQHDIKVICEKLGLKNRVMAAVFASTLPRI